MKALDDRTGQAIAAFLEAAAGIQPGRVTVARREVTETVPGVKRSFGRRGPDQTVKKTKDEYAPAHNVFSWSYTDTSSESRATTTSQALYVRSTGQLLLSGGWQYIQLSRAGSAQDAPGGHFTRGEGALPGFLAKDPYTSYGPLIPGLPFKIEALAETAKEQA